MVIKISGEFDDDDDDEYGTDYDPNDVDPENDPEISNDNDQDYDSDNATESGDYDPNDVDPENDSEISNDNDQDYDSDNTTESGDEYNPDYGNKEEIEDEGVELHTGEEQNEVLENLRGKEENIEEIMEEYSEPEAIQQEERVADSDSEIHEPKPEITSSVETENIGTEQSTITLQQQSQEQIPEHEPEDNEDIIELIDSEGEPLKPIQNEDEEINKIIFDAEKMEWKKMEFRGEHASSHEEMEVEMLEEEMEELFNKYVEMGLEQLETSYELNQENHQEQQELEERLEEAYTQEQESETSYELNQENHQEQQELEEAYTQEQELETSHELKQENHQEPQELEERLEEAYTQEQGLETSHELKQENHQEKEELEERLEEAYTQEQEEKVTLEMERAQEQDEKENIKESSHIKIKENMQELSQELEQSNRKSQEIEQKIMQEVHQNIVQEEIQEQVEKQKELTLKKSAKFFKERYREETGGRPIYAGKETKGFIEWKDHLKEQGEMQEENDNLFREKKKETREHSKVIRESKEEWAQYLENSIKEAEFSEEIKIELNEILEKYEQLRELLKNLKNKEISKEKFEKEVKEFEYLLIEKRYITRPLFMNFDWFRRYYNGRIKKAGKMVAHLYISKKTREFLSYISGRIEQLNNIGHSHENVEEFREFMEKFFQINEKWALLLNNLIYETPNEEISKEVKEELEVVIKTYCEIRAILLNKNISEVDKDKLIQERIEKSNPRFFELFEILKRFLGTYDNYSRKWMEQSLILEGKKTIRQLSQKIKSVKEEAVQEILNGDNSMLYKFKEILRVNLYKSTELNMNEKSKLLKIIQKKDISEEDRNVIKSLLGSLSKRELITLLQNDFKNYFLPKPDLSYEKRQDVKKEIKEKVEKLKEEEGKKKIIKKLSKGKNIFMPKTSDLFEKFLQYTHKIELIKDFINEFNKFGCWIKNLRPTKTFINFIKKKGKQLENISQNNSSSTIKNQVKIISNYITLIMKIRDNDILTRAIRNVILENKGKFNAYDIEEWLLISDTSARNQLKQMFTEDEYQKYIRTQKHVKIDTIRKIVAKKSGKCHTKTLKNAKSKLHLECAEGHHFFTTYDSIVYHETWCPDCNTYVGETICRRFFEKIFKFAFPKSYPEWLINENGNQMELDGYNKHLGFAFEYQGIQHRKKAFGMTDDDIKNLQKDDALKLKLCKENDVILLQIPDDEIIPYNKMQEYIEKEYERRTGNIIKNIPRYDYREFTIYENKYAKKFRVCVEKKGGTLMTPYFSAKKEITLICEKGHQWTTTPNSVYIDNWCSKCAGNMKGTTEYFRKIGREFNCELVNDYINAKKSLWYRCPKGHKFKKSPYWLKRTYKEIEILCPECKMDRYAEKFQDFVSIEGGHLLTAYKGRFKPIKIKCKNNHVRETTPAAVYQGSWCKACKK